MAAFAYCAYEVLPASETRIMDTDVVEWSVVMDVPTLRKLSAP
jgi:hypothetical protein